MKKLEIEKFSLQTIADAVRGSDVWSARSALSFALGLVLDVFGKVQKVVKREGLCKLVIESDNVPGFVVFADCPGELEKIKAQKIRKGSLCSVVGRFVYPIAVCESDFFLADYQPRV